MSARLIGELANWLLSPAAAGVTPHERLVLFVIAERSHERTRLMLRHRGDDMQLVDRIAATSGLARDGALKKAFQRLAGRGLEVRIPVKKGKDGKPVFTHEGHSMRFRLPQFPASVAIPERPGGPVDNEPSPVDNPPGEGAQDGPDGDERRDGSSHHSARGETDRPASRAQRRDVSSRPYPSNYLSGPSNKLDPSTSVRSPVAEEEGCPREPETIKRREFEFDFRSACGYLLQAPPAVQTAAMAAAEQELPGATNEALRIRAAEIAAKGIPA